MSRAYRFVIGSAVASVVSFILFQNFTQHSQTSSVYLQPFYKVGDRPYLPLSTPMSPAAALASSWDGRLYIYHQNVMPLIPVSATPVATFSAGQQILPTAQGSYSLTAGNATLSINTQNCTLNLYVSGTFVWGTSVPANCPSAPALSFGGDSNLVLFFPGQNLPALYASGTSCAPMQAEIPGQPCPGPAGVLSLYNASPYIAITNTAKNIAYFTYNSSSFAPNIGAWNLSLFSPEKMSQIAPAQASIQIRSNLSQLIENSFTPQTPFVTMSNVSSGTIYYSGLAPNYYVNNPSSINLGIAAAITRAPGYDINPYPSDASGQLAVGGPYLTYQVLIYSPANSFTLQPRGSVQCGSAYCFNAVVGAQIVVANPYTANASIAAWSITSAPQVQTDSNGNAIVAFELSVTGDGQLMIYHDQFHEGHLNYTFNNNPSAAGSGWSPAQDLSYMYTDAKNNKTPGLQAKSYPFSRYPLLDGLGAPINNGSPNPGQFNGGYPWISLDGADVFYQSIVLNVQGGQDNGAIRAGTAAIGSSTWGQTRQLDGGGNTTRQSNGTDQNGSFMKTGSLSLGRSPGMWSPLEFATYKVLPMVDKPYTYPMFSNGPGLYYEASFEELLSGNYDVFLDMSEPIQDASGNNQYVTSQVQDISGHIHTASLQGASFPEEAFPSGATLPDGQVIPPCTSSSCPLDDPMNANANLFSGKSVYFNDNTALQIPAYSQASGHTILGPTTVPNVSPQATDFSVSMAVLPVQDLSNLAGNQYRLLAQKGGTFSLVLEANRMITARLSVQVSSGSVQQLTMGFNSPALPLGQWSHVAFTYSSVSGTMNVYINGALATAQSGQPASTVFFPSATPQNPVPIAVNQGASVVLGPTGGSTGGMIYALDQFGLSRVARPQYEIERQAGNVLNRIATPAGQAITNQALRSPNFYLQSTNGNLVSLGNQLFFDPRLSPDATVSCATCHTLGTNNSLTETAISHLSRLAEFGGEAHLPRNTPSLLFLGFDPLYFRDGRSSTVFDQAHAVLNSAVEMGSTNFNPINLASVQNPDYPSLFQAAFPGQSSPITASNVQLALQAYEFSITSEVLASVSSPVDQFMQGDLSALNSEQLLLGKDLFFGKGRCAQCHSGSGFSDGLFHAIPSLTPINQDALVDQGRYANVNGLTSGGVDDMFKFKTPTLRNLNNSGPYYHNGLISSPASAVSLYTGLFNANGSLNRAAQNTAVLDDMLLPVSLGTSAQLQLNETEALLAFIGLLSGSGNVVPIVNPIQSIKINPAPRKLSFANGAAGVSAGSILQLNDAAFQILSNGEMLLTDTNGDALMAIQPTTQPPKGSVPQLLMQNGNLVMVAGGTIIWSAGTGTGPNVGSSFLIRDREPYLVVLDSTGNMLWESSQNFEPFSMLAGGRTAVIRYPAGSYFTQDGFGPYLFLVMQNDGNLVVYQGSQIGNGWTPLGASNTSNNQPHFCGTGCAASMQASGNIVLYTEKTPFANITNLNPPITVPGVRFSLVTSGGYLLQVKNPKGNVVWNGLQCNSNCPH